MTTRVRSAPVLNAGGGFGYRLSRRVAVEAEVNGFRTRRDFSSSFAPFQAQGAHVMGSGLLYLNRGRAQTYLLLGGGLLHVRVKNGFGELPVGRSANGFAINFGGGLKIFVSPHFSLRPELRIYSGALARLWNRHSAISESPWVRDSTGNRDGGARRIGYTCAMLKRKEAVLRGLRFIYQNSREGDNFEDRGGDYLWCFHCVASTSPMPSRAPWPGRWGRSLARKWQGEQRTLPELADADEVGYYMSMIDVSSRLGIDNPELREHVRQGSRRFTARDYLGFDPVREAPPGAPGRAMTSGAMRWY